jgi:hypothetical protein
MGTQMNNQSTAKIELLKKIINAHLTKEEMQSVTEKAQEILFKRVPKK